MPRLCEGKKQDDSIISMTNVIDIMKEESCALLVSIHGPENSAVTSNGTHQLLHCRGHNLFLASLWKGGWSVYRIFQITYTNYPIRLRAKCYLSKFAYISMSKLAFDGNLLCKSRTFCSSLSQVWKQNLHNLSFYFSLKNIVVKQVNYIHDR